MKIVKGDLIRAVIEGEVDVIAHGCNCFGTQKSGIAKQMVQAFGTDNFPMELTPIHEYQVNKLGQIDGMIFDRYRKRTEDELTTQRLMDVDYYEKGWIDESEITQLSNFDELPEVKVDRHLTQQVQINGDDIFHPKYEEFVVINAYTQYRYGRDKVYLDYDALRLCLRKMNMLFSNVRIGLPKIGCGLAGGDWSIVSKIIEEELKDNYVTIYEL